MTWLVPYLVFLHVVGVMLAFGPTFSYSIFGSLLKDEPQHRDFFGRAREKVSRQLTWPATLSLAVTGVLIVVVGGYDVSGPTMRWLQLAIVLYAGMVLYIALVLDPMNRRISAMGRAARERAAAAASGAVAPGSAAASGSGAASAGAGPGEAPPPRGGPPPELMALLARTRRDGKLLGVVTLLIVFLMVVKPGFPV